MVILLEPIGLFKPESHISIYLKFISQYEIRIHVKFSLPMLHIIFSQFCKLNFTRGNVTKKIYVLRMQLKNKENMKKDIYEQMHQQKIPNCI